jgi:hypothetical protein
VSASGDRRADTLAGILASGSLGVEVADEIELRH